MNNPNDANDAHVMLGIDAVKDIVENAARPKADDEKKEKDKSPTQSQVLMAIARGNCDLFVDEIDGEAFATLPTGATHAIKSRSFRMWLSQRFVGASGRAPSSQALNESINTIEAVVIGSQAKRAVYLRVGEEGGKIYIDLGSDDHKVVEVSQSGWRLVEYSAQTLRFRRSPSMRPLPVPSLTGSIDGLRKFLNVDDDGWRLAMVWLLYAYQARGPCPILVFGGEQGTAKTTASKMMRSLVDPSQAAVRSAPKDDDQLFVGVRGSRILAFDNLSGMPPWLSDLLCGLATGTAQSKRQLYTDGDEVIIQALRPIIVNGIDDMTARPDFASRALAISLSVISDSERLEESILWADFDSARPGIFGALLTALSKVLAIRGEIRMDRLPRMADFARFGVATERVLEWPCGSFMEAYESSQRASAATTMESNLVALAVQRFMASQDHIRITPTDLLPKLASLMTIEQIRSRQWPPSPNQLGNQLRRAAPALRQVGIWIDREKTHGSRYWNLTRVPGAPGAPTENRVPPENTYKNRAGGTGGTGGTLSLISSKIEREGREEEDTGGRDDAQDRCRGGPVPPGAPGVPYSKAPDESEVWL